MTYSELEIPGALEKHFSVNGARPVEKRHYRGFDVYLADGGPHFDAGLKPNLPKSDSWMKSGYYVSTWAINRGRRIIGQPLYFEWNHDLNLNDRQKARVEAAMQAAKHAIDDGYEAGWHG